MPALRREHPASRARRAVDVFLPALPEINFMNTVNSTPAKKPETAKKPDFECSLGRLEEIVGKLENANLSLDEAMKLFEEGVQLSRECQKHLEQAEGKVEILLKKAGGEMAAEAFDPEAEEDS